MINWDEKPEWADRVVVSPNTDSYYWASCKKVKDIITGALYDSTYHIDSEWQTIWPPSVSVSVDDKPDTGKHYRYQYKGIQIDPYRIFRVYGITDPAIQHAVKKLLVAGSRGSKSTAQDIQESIDALARWQSMEQEDSE